MIRPIGTKNVGMFERFANGCFYSKMKNDTHLKKSCYCLPHCNAKIYQTSHEQIPLDLTKVCESFPDLTARKNFMQLKFLNFKRFIDEFDKKWTDFKLINGYEDLYDCKSDAMKTLFSKDVVIIEIHLMDKFYNKGKFTLHVIL